MKKQMEQTFTKRIIVLCGIPCSFKSTWANKQGLTIASRDTFRDEYFSQPYSYSRQNEDRVTRMFDVKVKFALVSDRCIILDNCHTKESYLDAIIKQYSDCKIEIKFFDCSLIKAYYRNYIRYFNIGKWIPLSVIWHMYKNYKKINRKKYGKYLFV